MSGNSRISGWVMLTCVMVLAGCATEPYYESAPITPTSVSPTDDVDIGVNAQTTFAWLPTENTQYYEFHIYNQISKDTTQYLQENILPNAVCDAGLCRLTLNVELPITKGHAWRVRAGNNAGLSGWNRTRFNMIEVKAEDAASVAASSSAQAGDTAEAIAIEQASVGEEVSIIEEVDLEIDQEVEQIEEEVLMAEADIDSVDGASVELNSQPELNVPDLIQPVEGVKVSTGSMVDFKWRSIPNAVSYDFYIYDSVRQKMVESLTDIDASTLCRTENVCGLTRQVTLPEASHAWRVRANFESNQSPFSSSRFDVVR